MAGAHVIGERLAVVGEFDAAAQRLFQPSAAVTSPLITHVRHSRRNMPFIDSRRWASQRRSGSSAKARHSASIASPNWRPILASFFLAGSRPRARRSGFEEERSPAPISMSTSLATPATACGSLRTRSRTRQVDRSRCGRIAASAEAPNGRHAANSCE
jgi:hypothetical protein